MREKKLIHRKRCSIFILNDFVRLSSPKHSQHQPNIFMMLNSRISISYNSNFDWMFLYLFRSVKTFEHRHTHSFAVWNLVFWFAFNPINLCSFGVSSFWTTLTLFRVSMYVFYVLPSSHRITFPRKFIHSWILLYFKSHNNRIYPI